jgi:hypothetical protein
MPGYMYVKAGASCGMVLENSLGPVNRLEIVKQPANGRIDMMTGRFGLRYTPRKGFVGNDSFTFREHSLDPRTNRPMVRGVAMEVTVRR